MSEAIPFRAMVGPEDATSWLEAHHWAATSRLGDIAAIYTREDQEVLVPLSSRSSDFAFVGKR